jgi:hypothetical protein
MKWIGKNPWDEKSHTWTTKENTYDNMKRRREERKERSITHIWQERKKPMTTKEEKKNIYMSKNRKERKRMMNIYDNGEEYVTDDFKSI